MKEDRILKGLNGPQKEAVTHGEGPCLVIAGAGSGKTKVLTHRVAFLVEKMGVPENRILAVTFTNKAAGEMKTRISGLLGEKREVLVCTFHSFCVRVLRKWSKFAGLDHNFSIYDRDDQKALIKKCMEEAGLTPKFANPGGILEIISTAKNKLLTPEALERMSHTEFSSRISYVYKLYQERLRSLNALDFDDLLLETYLLFEKRPEVSDFYKRLFLHVLVDEFQDTNRVQYLILKKIVGDRQNVFVVGDDDQSIYGWRGAEVRNILNFPKDFPGTRIVKLEENYRSTKNIVKAAEAVISINKSRWKKSIFTRRGKGEPVYVFGASDQHQEARFVVSWIKKLSKRYRLSDIAILYRVNAQSRVMEEELLKAGIPHSIVGGVKFYERKEIKDIIAYLRFMVNPKDEISFLRIVNTPPRGIGKVTISKLKALADEKNLPLPCAFLENFNTILREKAKDKAEVFLKLLKLREENIPLYELVERVISLTGYREYLESLGKEEVGRLENIQEFLSVVREFEEINPRAKLDEFLEFIGLMTDIDTYTERENRVTLMTVHSAKGLEFPVVFVIGLEEGLFPLNLRFHSVEHVGDPEEETRLMYVAMTRAKDLLFLSYAEERLIFGKTFYNEPSRFLKHLPSNAVCYITEESSKWYQSP